MKHLRRNRTSTRKDGSSSLRTQGLIVALVGVAGTSVLIYVSPPSSTNPMSDYIAMLSLSMCSFCCALLCPGVYNNLRAVSECIMWFVLAVAVGVCWGISGLYAANAISLAILMFIPMIFLVCGNLLYECLLYLVVFASAVVTAYACTYGFTHILPQCHYRFALTEHYSAANYVIWLKEIGSFMIGFACWHIAGFTSTRRIFRGQ